MDTAVKELIETIHAIKGLQDVHIAIADNGKYIGIALTVDEAYLLNEKLYDPYQD